MSIPWGPALDAENSQGMFFEIARMMDVIGKHREASAPDLLDALHEHGISLGPGRHANVENNSSKMNGGFQAP